ncbi:MAG TPA: PIN domain-containing protein [Verrucomicrobiota bacterium]|nr:PIN domain-containing protein [Verrucomicrobiota bacterium]HNU50420.1 PIN domain-containing protein [Verrucomicrobiota bacterium]
MPAWLLDINVLVARQDVDHEHHERVARWWHQRTADGWATCPLTENGFVRILGHPSYPGWPGTPERAAAALSRLIAAIPGHQFLPDEISLLDLSVVPSLEGVGPRALTDLYLLALAVHHGAVFATLDARIQPGLVPGGPAAFVVIR